MNASALLMMALEGQAPAGPHRCFYCGNACSGLYNRKDHLSQTFTDFGSCVCPASQFVCLGCVLALREKVEMPGRDKLQKMRNYSWLLTPIQATPYSKAQVGELRAVCLDPPTPPWALAIATSGQKHLIFKTPACLDPDRAVVCLEGEVIDYAPDDMAQRLELVTRMSAVVGKPALSDEPMLSMALRLHEAHGDEGLRLYEVWRRIWAQPLSRLSVFLAPSMKEAKEDGHPRSA